MFNRFARRYYRHSGLKQLDFEHSNLLALGSVTFIATLFFLPLGLLYPSKMVGTRVFSCPNYGHDGALSIAEQSSCSFPFQVLEEWETLSPSAPAPLSCLVRLTVVLMDSASGAYNCRNDHNYEPPREDISRARDMESQRRTC